MFVMCCLWEKPCMFTWLVLYNVSMTAVYIMDLSKSSLWLAFGWPALRWQAKLKLTPTMLQHGMCVRPRCAVAVLLTFQNILYTHVFLYVGFRLPYFVISALFLNSVVMVGFTKWTTTQQRNLFDQFFDYLLIISGRQSPIKLCFSWNDIFKNWPGFWLTISSYFKTLFLPKTSGGRVGCLEILGRGLGGRGGGSLDVSGSGDLGPWWTRCWGEGWWGW